MPRVRHISTVWVWARADAKGTSYKYSVGMGEALVVSAESNWPSPVDLSDHEDEVDHERP